MTKSNKTYFQLDNSLLLMLTVPRSGSTWLSELIAINKLAYLFENLFFVRVNNFPKLAYTELQANVLTEFIDHIKNYKYHTTFDENPPQLYGSKLVPEDLKLLDHLGGIENLIHSPKINYILLWREDIYAQAFSFAQLLKTGQWYSSSDINTTTEISFEEFQKSLDYIIVQHYRLIDYIKEKKLSPLVFQYEHLKDNEIEVLRLIYKLCNLPLPKDLKINVPVSKNTYTNPENRSKVIKKSLFLYPENKAHIEKILNDYKAMTHRLN